MARHPQQKTTPPDSHKVGRLSIAVARKAGIRCADIYLSATYNRHIAANHLREIARTGHTPESYIQMILKNYNQVRKGSEDSVLLVVHRPKLSHVAAIRLNYITKKSIWEVRTAQPRKTSAIEKKKLLWEACPRPR